MSNLRLPEGFKKTYSEILGNDYQIFEDTLFKDRVKHFRINQHRGIEYLPEIEELGIKCEHLHGLSAVYKVTEGAEKLTETIAFQTGGIYIMNPSSVIPPMILTSLTDQTGLFLDVSAAPGGKTVALADLTENKGRIIANEPSKKRLKSLNYNLEKYGCWSTATISLDGRILDRHYENTFDGILLDAPCSNENKIGRNDTVRNGWDDDLVQRMAKLQREIAQSAWECLAAGGTLVYSTCTFSKEENEFVVRFILENNSDAELIDINKDAYSKGITGDTNIDDKVIRVWPHIQDFDGFFIAAIQKTGKDSRKIKNKKFKPYDKFEKFLNIHENNYRICKGDGTSFIEPLLHDGIKGRFDKSGMQLMKHEKDLTSAAVWEFGNFIKDDFKVAITREEADRYMKGFDLPGKAVNGAAAVFYEGIPVGSVKSVGSSLKNKLDRYFLYGKNIEY